ncbi:hypothetical protein ACTQ49_07245 [Luteococcus sp. Sow4_B9]|uniref:hypothetical protein n=1 Tax=Luteococcus sp. Sow4_B9 TaxID=3438792 RepID=UPI003F9E9B05
MMVMMALLAALWLTALVVVAGADAPKPDIARALSSDETIVRTPQRDAARDAQAVA